MDKIRDYKGGISRDFNICPDDDGILRQFYADNGQGCRTVWYPTLKQARNIIKLWNGKAPNGRDSAMCKLCGCHGEGFPMHACRTWKQMVALGEIGPNGFIPQDKTPIDKGAHTNE